MTITIDQLLRILSLQYKHDETPDALPTETLFIEFSKRKPSEGGKTMIFEGESRTVILSLLDDERISGIEIT
jgi:hypothetical protein